MPKPYDPAKHRDPLIPVEAVPTPAASNDENRGKKSAPARAVAYTACPDCMNKKVALVSTNGHLLYREHWKATFSGAQMQCRASWSRICDNPPGGLTVNGHGERTSVYCSHDQAAS